MEPYAAERLESDGLRLSVCVWGEGGLHTCNAGFFYTQVHRKEGDVANSVGFKD